MLTIPRSLVASVRDELLWEEIKSRTHTCGVCGKTDLPYSSVDKPFEIRNNDGDPSLEPKRILKRGVAVCNTPECRKEAMLRPVGLKYADFMTEGLDRTP